MLKNVFSYCRKYILKKGNDAEINFLYLIFSKMYAMISLETVFSLCSIISGRLKIREPYLSWQVSSETWIFIGETDINLRLSLYFTHHPSVCLNTISCFINKQNHLHDLKIRHTYFCTSCLSGCTEDISLVTSPVSCLFVFLSLFLFSELHLYLENLPSLIWFMQ